MELLGLAVKSDRLSLNITQKKLQKMVNEYAEAQTPRLYVNSVFVSNIERGITREISTGDRKMLAALLRQPPERYMGLETDPRKVITDLLNRGSVSRRLPGLERSIEFPPEYKQAGISILSYFAEILAKKYPENDVRVNILQNGNKVTLRIETLDGDVEKIERTLEEYGLVVTGKMAVETFTEDRELIRDLKTRLEVASLELRLRREMYLEDRKHYEARVNSLEDQVTELRQLISVGLTHSSTLADIVRAMIPVEGTQQRIASSLETIAELSRAEHTEENASRFRTALETVEKESPSIYARLLSHLHGIPAGIMANLATPWVQNILTSLPR